MEPRNLNTFYQPCDLNIPFQPVDGLQDLEKIRLSRSYSLTPAYLDTCTSLHLPSLTPANLNSWIPVQCTVYSVHCTPSDLKSCIPVQIHIYILNTYLHLHTCPLRFKLDKFVHLPCFRKTVVGCFVRCTLHTRPNSLRTLHLCSMVTLHTTDCCAHLTPGALIPSSVTEYWTWPIFYRWVLYHTLFTKLSTFKLHYFQIPHNFWF